MRTRLVTVLALALTLALLGGTLAVRAANPPTIASSTLVFQGTLTDNGDGTYSGIVPMVVGGGYDVYAEEGGTAWFGDLVSGSEVWTSVSIVNHDAWPSWDPDTPDWYQYSLNLYVDGTEYKWAVRNHAGATAEHPWYDEAYWGGGGKPAGGVPMSGLMHWGTRYAEETATGAYLPGTGTPEIAGGAAAHGGGPQAWDMDWSWGSESVPLQYPGFDVQLTSLGGGSYKVELVPALGPVVNLNTGTSYATIQAAVGAANAGHVIQVDPGTYPENVVIAKSVTLQGDPGDASAGPGVNAPVIDGGASGSTVDITASGVILKGFTVQDSGLTAADAGIRLYGVSGCTVNDNAVSANATGIGLLMAGSNAVSSNTVTGNAAYGIAIVAGDGNTLDLNQVTGNTAHAIALDNGAAAGGSLDDGATGNFIKGNTISGNGDGIFLGENCDGNQVTDGNQISGATGVGVSFWRSDGHTVTDNSISSFPQGIRLLGSSNNTISGNFVTGNTEGIKVDASWQVGVWYQSANNVVRDNSLEGNTGAVLCGVEQTSGVNASANWWGSADPAAVKTAANGGSIVDYTPWLASGTDTSADPGFQGDFSTLWVDDDSPQTGTTNRIKEGINLVTASTVNVAPGTYGGQIVIDKSVTLTGDPGDASAGPGPGAPVIDGGSAPGDAFLIENGVSNVTIQGFEVRNFTSDDTGIGNAVSAWEASTSNITIRDNYFHDLGYNGVLVGNDDAAGDHTNWLIANNIADNIDYIAFELTNTSNSTIEDNVIHLDTPDIGAIFSSARRNETGLTIRDNLIDGTPSLLYPVIYVYAYDLDVANPNLDNVLIEYNTISTAGTPYQVYVRNIGTGTVTNVTVYHNTLATFKNLTAAQVDAEHNYWGTVVYSEIVPKVSGDVDWSPWCNSDFSICTFSWPVHNITQGTDHQTIQAAVDAANAGDEIHADAGTYTEYVTINKNLTLVGASGATIQKPAGYVYYKLPDEGTTKSFRPIVLAYGGTITGGDGTSAATAFTIQGAGTVNVTISGFAVKAANSWTGADSNNYADAILLRNVVGTVSSTTIDDMLPADTNQLTLGIEVRGDNSDVTLSDNYVTEFGKVGILVAGNLGTPTATVTGNTVAAVYYGPYVTNGIEINYRSTGTVSGNTVTGASGAGTIWSGACIMLTDSDNVTVSGNDVSDCEIGISVGGRLNNGYKAVNNTIEGNTLDGCVYSSIEVNTNSQNTIIRNNTITGVAARGGTEEAGILILEYSNPLSGYPDGVLIEGNTISGDPGFWGIDIYRNADNVTIQNNDITGGAVGVALELKEYNSVGKTVTIGGATGKANSFTGQTVLAVSTGPYDYSGFIYQWTPDANASANWWGDATPAGVAAAVSANVDYTPWLASGTDTSADSGFQGDFSTLWVDDDCPQTGAVGRVQEGVNLVSGSTVYVAAGTYPEPVNVEAKAGLTISGEARATVFMQPTSTLCFDVGGYACTRRTPFRVVSSTNVVLEHMTFDFASVMGNNIIGLLYWDSTGTVTDNTLKNMSGSDASGYYYEITSYVRAPSYTDAARAQVAFTSNSFVDTGRLGIVTHDFVHTTITGNTFHKDFDDFGYAMEIGSRSTATISTNVIDGYDTPAASDGSESGGIYIENSFTGGMGPLTKSVSLTGNEIFGNQWGIFIGNEWETLAGDVDIVVTATGNNLYGNIDGAVYITDEEKEDGSSVTYTGSGNTLTDNGGYGYSIYTAGDGAVTVSLEDETISGHSVGISLEDGGVPSASTYDIEVHNSSITGNTTFGVQNLYSETTIDAERNWWGEACGPVTPANLVSGNVDYIPWWSNSAMTIPGPIAGQAFTVPTGATTAQTQAILDCAGPGSTVTFQGGSYPGGLFVNNSQLTLELNGCIVGGPAPAFTIVGDDEVLEGPGSIAGAGSGSGIVVNAGADNFILEDAHVTGWANGIELAGDVESFKVMDNWIHSNTANGLLVDADVDLLGVVTIDGNLFKVNGLNGIQHNGNGTLPAEYNSWGDVGGYSTGDGIGGDVDADPFTYIESFFDVWPDGLVLERHVPESTSFDVALKADAVNVYGVSFEFTYDPAVLTLGPTTFSAPWAGKCYGSGAGGVVSYVCTLLEPEAEWTAAAGTIATFGFTAYTLPDNTPDTTYLNLLHLEADTSAGAKDGQRIYVNNAGFNDPSTPERAIADTDDGRIIVERLANYTGYIDLQGRANDSGALLEVHAASTYGSTLLASGTSASSGKYTTSHISPYWLGAWSTYWFQVDRALYLPTTAVTAGNYGDSAVLSAVPLTALAKVVLLGGDASDDNSVLVTDLACIGGNYGGAGMLCAGTGWTDVNGDGIVNVQDLSMAGGNLYKTSSPWTP